MLNAYCRNIIDSPPDYQYAFLFLTSVAADGWTAF
jgi:hypothetical protein